MRRSLRGGFGLAGVLLASSAAAQCQKDTDCAGEQVCEQGRCVLPNAANLPPAAPTAATFPVGTPLSEVPEGLRDEVWQQNFRRKTLSTNLAATGLALANEALNLNFSFHLALTRRVELSLGTSYATSLRATAQQAGETGGKPQTYGSHVGARFFPLGEAPVGPWLGARLSFSYLTAPNTSGMASGAGLEAGWSFEFFGRLALTAGLGAVFSQSFGSGALAGGLAPIFHLGVGLRF